MFKVGEAVVHPAHGAGYIKSIEKRVVGGKEIQYYKIAMISGSLEFVMVPIDKAEELGIRRIYTSEKIDALISTLKEEMEEKVEYDNWNQFYRENFARMTSGNLEEVIKLFKTLKTLSKYKKLGVRDSEMLRKARKIIISEIVAAKSISPQEAAKYLNIA
jgi:CarD family transcriptional regulator